MIVAFSLIRLGINGVWLPLVVSGTTIYHSIMDLIFPLLVGRRGFCLAVQSGDRRIQGHPGHSTRPLYIRFCAFNTRYYGDKILYKNLDFTQDFPNKILFHSLWEQNLVQNFPKIFRLPEMYSFGKILAQDFQMAAITKILMRRENQLRRFFSWGISDKQKTENT